MLRTITV